MINLIDHLPAILTGLSMLIGAVTGLIVAIVKLWERSVQDRRRHDLLLQAILRRGTAESRAKLKQLAPEGEDMTATLDLRADVRAAYGPIAGELRRLYRARPGQTREDFFEIVERRYGDWLVRHICVPLDVSEFACHDVAWIIAQEPPGT